MPELPDLTVYLEHLDRRTRGAELIAIRLASPFVLRTVAPTVAQVCGRRVLGWHRLAKQLVLSLDGDYYVVIHLMISGRLRWERVGTPVPKRNGLAAFDFDTGTVILTEASKKRRASLKLVEGAAGLAALDPGGIDVLDVSLKEFACPPQDRQSHRETRADRSTYLRRHRQRIFGRDSAARAHVAVQTGKRADRRRGETTVRRVPRSPRGMDRATARTIRRRLSRRRSRRFTTKWPCTASSVSRARCAARRCNASCTRKTRATTARNVRRRAGCSPIARCRVC